jgi:hypothetical protein
MGSSRWKSCMWTDPRLIGFAASRLHAPLSKRPHTCSSIHRSLGPLTDRAHSSSRNSSSECLRSRSSPFTFRCSASPALGFRSLFATSLEHSYVFSRRLPRPASFRPQVFTTSRRLVPLSSLQAYSIPQPRPGSSFVQGLLSRRSHASSSEAAFLPAVDAPPLVPALRLSSARVPSTCGASRLRGLDLRRAAFFRSGYSPRPNPLPSSNFMLLQDALSRRRPPLARRPSALHVARSVFVLGHILRRVRANHLRGPELSMFARAITASVLVQSSKRAFTLSEWMLTSRRTCFARSWP